MRSRSQYPLLIVIVLTVLVGIFSKQYINRNVYEVEINGRVATHSIKSIRIEKDVLYIASSYLEENSELKVSEFNNEIIVTYNGKSINFSIRSKDALKKGRTYFLNLRKLIDELGGKYVWDKDNKMLIIDF